MTTVAQPRPSTLRTALGMMLNPGGIVRSAMEHVPWPFSLLVSALAFSLFFLQTGLDLARTGAASGGQVALLGAVGAVYGSVGMALIALLAWLLTKVFGNKQSLKWTIAAFGLSYCSTFIYAAMGLGFSLALGWNTSVAFGVSGVLWALGPMIAVIKEMTGGRLAVSIIIATACGGLLLFGWALLGGA